MKQRVLNYSFFKKTDHQEFPHLYAARVPPRWWEGAIPFLLANDVVVRYKSSMCLICRWSQLDLLSYHCWIYFTEILQRSERLSDISHSVLSAEGMMSGTANKVCVKSLNKAWNWRDACLSEAPGSRGPLAADRCSCSPPDWRLPLKSRNLSQHF